MFDRVLRRSAILVITLTTLATGSRARAQDGANRDEAKVVREGLEAIAAGRGDFERFSVTFDDLHPLHGGLRLSIRGDGRVEQRAERRKVGEPREKVDRAGMTRLAALLVRQKAWEQRVADREPREDESRASLTIRHGKASVRIWEWHNELAKGERIGRIRDEMTATAWVKRPAP
jgi:hypothetical protein